MQRFAPGDANFSHLPCDQRGMRSHAAASGEYSLGGVHAADIIGAGFDAAQDHALAALFPLDRIFGVKYDATRGRARSSGQTLAEEASDSLRLLFYFLIEDRPQQLIELVWFDAPQCRFLIDNLRFDHVDGDPHSGEAGTLAGARLQHPELAVLNGEFDVLHVAVVVFERFAHAAQIGGRFGHNARKFGNRFWRTDTRHNVLALSIDKELAIKSFFARRWIAREGYAGRAVITKIAKDHRLNVNCRAPRMGYLVKLAIRNRAIVVPRTEHRSNGAPQLFEWLSGKFFPQAILDLRLIFFDECFQVFGGKLGIKANAASFLFLLEDGFERIGISLLFNSENHIGIHLNEPAVRIKCKSGILGALNQSSDRVIVQTQIEHRVHHPRHGLARAGTNRNQQRVFRIAKATAEYFFHARKAGSDLGAEFFRVTTIVTVIIFANLGGNREPGRNGNTDAGHFMQARAFSAEKLAHPGMPFGLAAAKREYDFFLVRHVDFSSSP